MSGTTAYLKNLESFLLRARNGDGGWAYQPGKASRLEPTCWALLALGTAADPTVLMHWPATGGRLLEQRGGSPNYAFQAQALLALRARQLEHAEGNQRFLTSLSHARGDALENTDDIRQDNSLQGWSWIDGTFSWVEPTAWCLLALKQWRRAGAVVDSSRIEVGERLLVDRCCVQGGWNYGNSNVLGQELKPFVPTTALALLALQDKRVLPEVVRSIDFLEREATQERSGMALSLALMALHAFERPVAAVRDALIAQVPVTTTFGKVTAAALTSYALNEETGHAAVVL